MPLPDANIRSPSLLIAEMKAQCAHCNQLCRVIALALPPLHEVLVDGEWQKVEASAFIFHVAGIPNAVTRLLLENSADFHPTGGADPSDAPWANHCPHCAGIFSDEELHCEPGGFMPSSSSEARAILLTQVEQSFSASVAGYALEPEFLSSMRRR